MASEFVHCTAPVSVRRERNQTGVNVSDVKFLMEPPMNMLEEAIVMTVPLTVRPGVD